MGFRKRDGREAAFSILVCWYGLWTFNRIYLFLDDYILLHIRSVYTENVELQLVRIKKRVGRYMSISSVHPDKSTAALQVICCRFSFGIGKDGSVPLGVDERWRDPYLVAEWTELK